MPFTSTGFASLTSPYFRTGRCIHHLVLSGHQQRGASCTLHTPKRNFGGHYYPRPPSTGYTSICSGHHRLRPFAEHGLRTLGRIHSLVWGSSFATLESAKLFQLDPGITYHLDSFSCLVLTSVLTVSSSPIDDALSTHHLGLPPTTVLFLKPDHLHGVVDAIMANAKKSFLFPLAWRHKLAGIFEGFFTKESLWDRLVFDNARSAVFGDDAPSIRGLVVSDGNVPASLLTPGRIALSVPLVITHTHSSLHPFWLHTHKMYRHSLLLPTKLLPTSDHQRLTLRSNSLT